MNGSTTPPVLLPMAQKQSKNLNQLLPIQPKDRCSKSRFCPSNSLKTTPEAYSYLITLPAKANGAITISSYLKSWNKYNRVSESYDRYSGQLIRWLPFNKLNNGDQVYQLNYDLHTGSVLALPGKILAFLCSLILYQLAITGFWIWSGRNKSSKKIHNKLAIKL